MLRLEVETSQVDLEFLGVEQRSPSWLDLRPDLEGIVVLELGRGYRNIFAKGVQVLLRQTCVEGVLLLEFACAYVHDGQLVDQDGILLRDIMLGLVLL